MSNKKNLKSEETFATALQNHKENNIRVAKKLIHNEIMPLDSDFHVNNHVSNYLRQEFNEKN